MGTITVLTFGAIRDIVGESRFEVADVFSTNELKNKLETEFPKLKSIDYAIAVNKKMVAASTALNADATVALLPPFSGG